MKTTELYIEQVLIGFLIIVIVLLPWAPELISHLRGVSLAPGIVGGTTAVSLAFWLGIPFERFADTLSERLERHSRLRFALEHAKGKEFPSKEQDGRLASDLYPENQMRVRGLDRGAALVKWIDYHRSRIRLARAFAVYGPALTVTLTLGVLRICHPSDSTNACGITESTNTVAVVGIAAAYLLWAILATVRKELAHTGRDDFYDYALYWDYLKPGFRIKQSKYGDWQIWVYEWPVLIAPAALLAAALYIGLFCGGPYARLAGAAGTALTILFAWSWWRISFTYRSYLQDIEDYAGKKA